METWMANPLSVGAIRDRARALVPDMAERLAREILRELPSHLLHETTEAITKQLQNKLVQNVYRNVHYLSQQHQHQHQQHQHPHTVPSVGAPSLCAPAFTSSSQSQQQAHAHLASHSPGVLDVTREPTVILWPSETYAYAGYSGRMSRCQALAMVWQRTHAPSFHAARESWLANGRRPARVTARGVAAAILSGSAPTPPQSTGKRPRTGTSGGAGSGSGSDDPFPHVKGPEDVRAFREKASSTDILRLYRAKGAMEEEATAECLALRLGQPLHLRNTASYWRADCGLPAMPVDRATVHIRTLGPITDPGPFAFMGEVDGWLSQPPFEDVIVELKLRMTRIPDDVSDADMLQAQTYMAMCNVDRVLHVQRVLGETDVVLTTVQRNTELWDATMVSLRQFVCDVRRLLRGGPEDVQLRHQALQAVETLPAPPLRQDLPPMPACSSPAGAVVPELMHEHGGVIAATTASAPRVPAPQRATATADRVPAVCMQPLLPLPAPSAEVLARAAAAAAAAAQPMHAAAAASKRTAPAAKPRKVSRAQASVGEVAAVVVRPLPAPDMAAIAAATAAAAASSTVAATAGKKPRKQHSRATPTPTSTSTPSGNPGAGAAAGSGSGSGRSQKKTQVPKKPTKSKTTAGYDELVTMMRSKTPSAPPECAAGKRSKKSPASKQHRSPSPVTTRSGKAVTPACLTGRKQQRTTPPAQDCAVDALYALRERVLRHGQ